MTYFVPAYICGVPVVETHLSDIHLLTQLLADKVY